MRKEGITMLQIVVSVVIMIILVTVAVFYGTGTSEEANIASIYNEVKEVESALTEGMILRQVSVQEEKLNLFDEILIEPIQPSEYATVLNDNPEGAYDPTHHYYYLAFVNSREIGNTLEIENVRHDYLFDFESHNIYLIKGIELNRGNSSKTTYNSDDIVDYYQGTFRR